MALPPCHSRRFFEGTQEVFFCAHPLLHARDNVVVKEVCQICPYWKEPAPEQFRPFTPGPPPRPRGTCLYLGGQIGLRDCPTCSGSVKVKVFSCAHPAHGETTRRECEVCRDHRERPPGDQASAAGRGAGVP
jgi:hypothetical protein